MAHRGLSNMYNIKLRFKLYYFRFLNDTTWPRHVYYCSLETVKLFAVQNKNYLFNEKKKKKSHFVKFSSF